MPLIRVTEVLAALSLTTDLASGAHFEKGLATCLVATSFAEVLELDAGDRRAVFHAALLRAVGCTSYAVENAALFDDDVAFQAALKALDPGDPDVFGAQLAQFGAWSGPAAQPVLAQRFVDLAGTEGPRATSAACEVSRALGPRLGLPPLAVAALDDMWERWDGLGLPGLRSGEQIPLVARIVHLAEQAVRVYPTGGCAAAAAEVQRRSGGHLDPGLARRFLVSADQVMAVLAVPDLLEAVVAIEPGVPASIRPDQLENLCAALAIVVDLKGGSLIGHSAHVAGLADGAAAALGLSDADRATVRAGALLHDLGRAAVSSAIWDRPGPLGAADWEVVRLHAYWTGRILLRCPGLAHLAPIAEAHHERLDGSGYHRGARPSELSPGARIVAAADVFAALTEPRPYRPALAAAEAAGILTAEVAAGRLDREAVGAVICGSGLPRPRADWPSGLTDREVDVLRLAARGWSNRQIADQLALSGRTVETHLKHVYDKTGRRTRAGAAVFAMEHGLLPADPG